MTILVVDDSISMRQMIKFALESGGYKVDEAADGTHGVALAQKASYELIITDINMHNMNGIDMIKRVRQLPLHKYTPILVLSTESSPNLKLQGKEAGATGWITKPCSPEKLVAMTKKALG